MEWKRFQDAQAAEFAPVWALYEGSFPENEQRLPDDQARAMGDEAYACEAAFEGGQLLALLFSWDMGDWRYVEHFAVSDALRGTGVGTRVLKDFFARSDNVVLEIDPPVTPVAQRREQFYQRMGMVGNAYEHRHPPYREGFAPHALKILSYPRAMRAQEYEAFAKGLTRRVMRYALSRA